MFSLPHTKVILLTSFLSHLIVRQAPLFITVHLSSKKSCLKISNKSFYHFTPALWNSVPPDLHRLSHHFTSSEQTAHNSRPSEQSTYLYWKAQNSSFHSSIPPQSAFTSAFSGLIAPVLTKLCCYISYSLQYHSSSSQSRQLLFYFLCKCLRIIWH